MSTSSTYLTLTLPVGTERRQLSIWNANWNAVDAAFNPSSIGAAGLQVAMLRDTAQNPTYTTSATKMLNLTPTWNHNSAHTLVFANVTDTLSSASALLADLQVGGISQWKVNKSGVSTQIGGVVAPTVGPASGQQHTLPAVTSDTVALIAATQELTNKTLNASVGKGTWTASGTWTIPAVTLGGTVSGGGNQINNVVIGAVTPLAATFTGITLTTAASTIIPGATSFSLRDNANANDNLLMTNAGAATIRAGLTVTAGLSTTNDVLLVRGGATTPPTGTGVEILYSTPVGYVRAYDRALAAYKNLTLNDTLTIVGGNGTSTFGGGVTVSAGGEVITAGDFTLTAGRLILNHTGSGANHTIGNGGMFNIGGTNPGRSGGEPTNALNIFNGTAPLGTMTNGATFYAAAGEMRVMDAAGNSTLLSPHDSAGNWVYDSVSPITGKHLHVDMERLVRALDHMLGGGFIHEETIADLEARLARVGLN